MNEEPAGANGSGEKATANQGHRAAMQTLAFVRANRPSIEQICAINIPCFPVKLKWNVKKQKLEKSKRGKSRGSQAVAQRCLTIAGKYGTSGWFGTARREPR